MRTGSDVQPIVSLGRIRQHEPRVAGGHPHHGNAHRWAADHRHHRPPRRPVDARLEALFLRIVDVSPGALYLTSRLNAARRLVVDTNLPIADIAERTGFSAIASLFRAFSAASSASHPRVVRRAQMWVGNRINGGALSTHCRPVQSRVES